MPLLSAAGGERRFGTSALRLAHSLILSLLFVSSSVRAAIVQAEDATFTVHSTRDGNWSDSNTWAERRVPTAGDLVQIRGGTTVVYDASSDQVIRTIHVAGTLRFSRDRSTRLTVGLIKIQAGEKMSEDGFACDAHESVIPVDVSGPAAALEIGTVEQPIPAGITAVVRLAYVDGMNAENCPAIIVCGGRWDVHGSPMSRTWMKLAADAKAGDAVITLAEPVTGWHSGDHVFVTSSKLPNEVDRSFRTKDVKLVETEDAVISAMDGATVTLDHPLRFAHKGSGATRCEIANLTRNVVIESADPAGVRGHTMYHVGSSGSISYAEFRHLGKEGVLGKYAIHFHLCRDSMRGSGVTGASIWDSANRWVTIHGTDHLLVRDCVGYGSIGHGFFLEDGSEAYNVLDRNLAVHAYKGKPLPRQALDFDSNDGAGFWWAAGRNTLVRNVSCENDQYGFHFDQSESRNQDFHRPLEMPDGSHERVDIRTVPFFRFEENESHCDGLYSFNFGADRNGAVHGDRRHPFICRNLLTWETHYAMRPMMRFFLMDGLSMIDNVYGVYHPDYDAHVYRNIYLNHVESEPINRGHDDEDNQYGTFTYENLTLENCSGTLIQLTSTAPTPDVTGHFRNVIVKDVHKYPRDRATVDLGTGSMNPVLEQPVVYYFHDLFKPGESVKIVSNRFAQLYTGSEYHAIPNFTGPRVKATEVTGVEFPDLLDPIDDLPPATMITSVRREGGKVIVTGVTTDNGEIATVMVNGVAAPSTSSGPGIVDWRVTLDFPSDGKLIAKAIDKAGNAEIAGHQIILATSK